MKIFIVEDEASSCKGLISIMHNAGISMKDIILSNDGKQGLSMFNVHTPEIAFVDIRMPNMSGLEMIRRAKQISPETIFVLMSAYSEFEYAKEALHLGIKDYLVKPIDPDEVIALLRPFITSQKKSNVPMHHPMVRKMLCIIEQNYSQPLNLASISDELHLTPEYLSNLFRRDLGINFSTYLRHYRIERALDMMQNGVTRIYDIAYACGFSDTKYFCRVFHDITGKTPTNYLKDIYSENGFI